VFQANPLITYRELGVGKDKAGEFLRELKRPGMIEDA
jgi:hypothetical protein